MVITDALHPYPLLVIFSLHPPFLLLTFSASSVGYTRQKGKMENLSLCFSLSSNFSLFVIFSLSFRSFLHFFMSKDFKLYYCYCYHCYYYYCYYCYLLSVCLIWDLSWQYMRKTEGNFWKLVLSYDYGFQEIEIQTSDWHGKCHWNISPSPRLFCCCFYESESHHVV